MTVGASQALYLVGQALLNPGDEAVLIAPAFDIYSGAVSLAGGTPRYVPLRVRPGCTEIRSSADLAIDIDELRENLSERTKLLFLNSPHNPTGKVFSRTEYEAILSAVEALAPHCVVVSDEVYERLVYDGAHVPFASVSEAAFARTLSVYSAGKTFSATGIKLGWVVGPAGLLHDLKLAHQYMVFATNHPAQAAVAEALQVAEEQYEGCETYYEWVCEEYRRKREAMVEAVVRGGMQAIRPEGAFYVCAIVPSGHRARGAGGLPEEVKGFLRDGRVQVDEGTVEREDYNVCRVLTARFGVAAIPNSAFFPREMVGRTALATDCVRFAFCKKDHELEEAAEKLRKVAG